MADNPYLDPVTQTLPRLLALFDRDRTSASHGMGDRFHWAWGLIDFGNASFQGAAHGMARLWRAGQWPYATSPELFLQRIDALFDGARRLTRRDGSLEEAFPNEGSYCVTALVAFDLLCALDLLAPELTPQMAERWKAVVAPMVSFLDAADETHAFISNHLATAAAALVRWHALTADARSERRARGIVERILGQQSSEGWFKEYDGADPGYQSLCTYYLADVHRCRPDWQLAAPLASSVRFLWHFAHPDGSFGGLYGSRCTRLFYPAGLEALARDIPEAAALAQHMALSIAAGRVVTLASMDEPNLVPMFNAYCWAAALWPDRPPVPAGVVLPALRHDCSRLHFAQAGLWIDAGPRHYTVVSTHKGGVVVHCRDGQLVDSDAGVVVRNPAGRLGSTQTLAADNRVHLDGEFLVVAAPIRPMPKRLPTPAGFLVLRLLCLSVFRARSLREWVKRRLVKMLIAGQRTWPASNLRRIRLGPELTISDDTTLARGYACVEAPGEFVSIHMASQGYWQVQDEAGAVSR
jgi:hypothetical protein